MRRFTAFATIAFLVAACGTDSPDAPPANLPGIPSARAVHAADSLTAAITSRLSGNPVNRSLRVAHWPENMGGGSNTSVLGRTFVVDPATGGYVRDDARPGAPTGAVRFVLYDADTAIRLPLVEIGFVDLVPALTADDSSFSIHAVARDTTLDFSGVARRAEPDYPGEPPQYVVRATGGFDDGGNHLNFSLDDDRRDGVAFRYALASGQDSFSTEGFRYGGFDGDSHAGTSVVFEDPEFGVTRVGVGWGTARCGPGGGSVSVNDRVIAMISFGSEVTLTTPDSVSPDTLLNSWRLLGNACLGGPASVIAVYGSLFEPIYLALRNAVRPGADLTISVTTSGSNPDGDGYVVTTDEGTPHEIGVAGTVVLKGLSVGPHFVELSGVAAGCSVSGIDPRHVDIPVGGSQLAFEVTCGGPLRSGRIGFEVSGGAFRVIGADGSGEGPLVGGLEGGGLRWSPSGERIAYLANCSNVVVSQPDGSAPVNISPAGSTLFVCTPDIDWAPDGTRLLYQWGNGFAIGQANGSGQTVPPMPSDVIAGDARWSPDGSRIAYTRYSSVDGTQLIQLANADGLNSAPVFPTGAQQDLPVWAPDGNLIAFRGPSGIEVVAPDGSHHLKLTDSRYDNSLAWTPDGSRLAFARFDSVFTVPRGGGALTLLMADPYAGFAGALAWSPDGAILALHRQVDSSARTPDEVYLLDAAGRWETRLTHTRGARNPQWQP